MDKQAIRSKGSSGASKSPSGGQGVEERLASKTLIDEFSFAAFVDYQLFSIALATLREEVFLHELAHLEAPPS